MNTHKYTISYVICLSRCYYKLGSRFKYKRGLKPKCTSEDDLEFAKVISPNVQNILFALEENTILQCSKPEDPSNVPNPHGMDVPLATLIGIRWKDEEARHLHIGDNKGKA
jgi:hypothetical protein